MPKGLGTSQKYKGGNKGRKAAHSKSKAAAKSANAKRSKKGGKR